VAVSDTAAHRPQHARGAKRPIYNTHKHTMAHKPIAYRNKDTTFWKLVLLPSSGIMSVRTSVRACLVEEIPLKRTES
jgi:hypothetical protein